MAYTYEPIATTTLGSNALSYTFTSIPGTYTDLVLVTNAKSTQTGSSGNGMRITYNSDTATNYSEIYLTGDGTTASSGRVGSQGYLTFGDLPQTSNTAWNANVAHIMNYSNTTTYKTSMNRSNIATLATQITIGLWRSTAAITSIKIERDGTNSIAAGSQFTLYGIKAA